MAMTLGEKIKALRLKKGMTLEDLGTMIGVSKTSILKWERGDIASMRLEHAARAAEALGVPVEYFTGGDMTRPADTEVVTNESLVILARAAKRLSPEEQEKLLNVVKAMHPEAFDEADA